MESSTENQIKAPLVSVLLSVHNGELTLSSCLESIKNQTYRATELIIIDDGSTDATPKILQAFAKTHECNILTNQESIGLTQSLNKGLKKAQGKYIARIDADDTWHHDKITQQINFLEAHPKVGVLGTWYINKSPQATKHIRLPIKHAAIAHKIYRSNPFGHSCVVIRKNMLDKVNGYNNTIRYGQDYDLWLRLFSYSQFHNLPEFLCTRNIPTHPNRRKQRKQMKQMIRTIMKQAKQNQAPLTAYLGILTPLAILFTPTWVKKLRP